VACSDLGDIELLLVRLLKGKVGPQVEQLILNLAQRGSHFVAKTAGQGHPEQSIQLVHGAVRGNAPGILGHALPTAQGRRSLVSLARVNFR
jgi:hypothetical protein